MHFDLFLVRARAQSLDQRMRPSHRRHAGHVVLQSGAPDCLFVIMRSAAQRSVDYQSDLALLDVISDVRPALVDFEDRRAFEANFAQTRGRSDGRHQIKSETREPARQQYSLTLICLVNADECGTVLRQFATGGSHRLRVRFAETFAYAHDFASRM